MMSTQILTYIFVGATFALYLGIAIWSKAKSTNDFYVAGKGVHPVANGMATAADWMSAASFLSMAGLIAFLGKDGSVYLIAENSYTGAELAGVCFNQKNDTMYINIQQNGQTIAINGNWSHVRS